MPKINILILLSSLFCIATSTQAGSIIKVFVGEQDGHFLIDLTMQVNAAKPQVIRVMTDYNQLTRLSDTIVSSEIMEQRGNYTRIKLVNEGCVLFICETITQIQNINKLDYDYISVNVEPLADNIKFSSQLWHFESLNTEITLIHYSADVVPDFWIPPVIGSWIVQKRLVEEVQLIINNAEKLANPEAATGAYPEE